MITALIFILGLIIGSFLNVCIHRMPKKKSIFFQASHCPSCKKNIFWYDNIPVLSYMILAGECRFCKSKISFRYPVVETLTALLFTVLFIVFGMSPKFFSYSIMTCGLIVATFIDFKIQEIPDEISLVGIAIGFLLAFTFPSVLGATARAHGLLNAFIGAVVGGGSIFLLRIMGKAAFKKEAMGGGDVKLMAMIGSFFGLKMILLTFFIAPFLGIVPGVISKFKNCTEYIPYGPFLSAAALVTIFFGNSILGILFGTLF